MLGMTGIGDDLKKPLVTRGATNILGWARSGTGDTGGVARRGVESDQALEGYVVLPVVTEVIEVQEAFIRRASEVAQSDLCLVK